MARPRTPLWLVEPSRYAGRRRRPARWALAVLGVLLVLCLSVLATPGPPPVSHDPAQAANDEADVVLYQGIVEGVRHGGAYYPTAAAELRKGDYPLKPFVTFRLPTLALVQASLPGRLTILLLYALALAVLVAWFRRLRGAFRNPRATLVAVILLAAGMVAFVQADLAPFHEVWAGLLIALSLAVRRPGRWVEGAALGAIALLVRETALLYVLVMAASAWLERERREALGWGLGVVVFAVAIAAHAHAVSLVVRPDDPVSPGWAGMLGFGFFVKTMELSTALHLAPEWLAALLVGLALFGWSAWRDPTATRALAIFAAYAVLIAIAGRTDTFYWGLLVAPLLLVGLAFVPDGVRDLIVAALDRRRITVTRLGS